MNRNPEEGEDCMKEWMIRCAAGLAAAVLLIFFVFSPTGEENREFGFEHDGRGKYQLADGESLSWEWIPEVDGITEITLKLRGLKNAQAMTLEADIASAEGEKNTSVSQAVSELGEDGLWKIQGFFTGGKTYQITVRASGEGNVKLNGTEEEEDFFPYLQWTKTTRVRHGTLLYLAVAFLLFALFPVPAKRKSAGRVRKLLGMGALILLSVFWFMQTLGTPLAYSMEESILLAWCLHFGAWIYLGVMGKLLFGSEIPFERKAAVGVVMLGVLFIFAITPKSGPDEPAHFNQAYGVSNYLLFQPEKSVGDARDYDLGSWEEHINSPSGYTQVVQRLFEPRSEDESKVHWVPTSFTYPLMYLPQAVGLALGRLLRTNTLMLYYLGRLFNLLFYALCIFLAVRAVPRKKELFFGIGMMPMAIHQAASYSYDAFTNGMAILWIALALRAIWEERPFGGKETLSLILVGGLLAPSKVGYIVLAGLLFLIPQKRFQRWSKPLSLGVVFLAMLGITALFWLPNALNGTAIQRSGEDVYTIPTLLQQPLPVLRTLFYSVEENLPEWLVEAVGFVFSGYSLWIQIYLPVLYLILLAVLAQRKTSDPLLGSRHQGRAVLLTIIGIGILMIELIEMLSWTPVGSTRVIGIQGRYFIPLLPLVFLALETKSIQRGDSVDDRKLAWGLVFLHVLTVEHILIQTIRGV